MAAQSNIDIKIIAEFLGKNAFKQADVAAKKLNNTVKSLGSSFGLAFGGAALGYAVKSTIKDFADAQRETQNLTNTVKNLGIAFDAPQLTAYVEKIGKLYGITGEQAVPAMQALVTATGSVSKATDIMNVALDLAASRSADVTGVAQDLASAYVGNTKGLNQYRLGLTKAELSAMTFDEILATIGSQTMGAAEESAQTLSGQLAILAEVSNQAKERIGGGLFEALGGIAGKDGAAGAAANIENLSMKLTNAITGFGYLVREVKIAQPILVTAGIAVALAWAPWFTGISVAALAIAAIGNKLKKNAPQTPTNTGKLFFPSGGDGGYAEREKARKKADKEAIARAKQLAKLITDQAKAAQAALKAKQLQNAIDKANIALGKSDEIFNLDKIQVAAALANQAELLGKATTGAQVLAIANDTARLNVKRDILDLEDAIAAKDQAAIEAATKKLNADMAILGSLQGQSIKLLDIKSILDTLKPKDLINLDNLNEALRLLGLINLANTGSKTTPSGTGTGGGGGGGNTPDVPPADTYAGVKAKEGADAVKYFGQSVIDTFQTVEDSGAFNALVKMYAGGAINPFNAGSFRAAEGGSLFNSGAVGSRDINITVNTGIGDPNAIAEAVNQVIQDAVDRGTLRGGAY